MNKALKITLIVIGSILLLFFVGVFVADYIVENKINKKLSSLPDHIQINYDELDVDVLGSRLQVNNPKIKIHSKSDGDLKLQMQMKQMRVVDVSYWDYLFNDAVNIDSITFDGYSAKYKHDKRIKRDQYEKRVSERLDIQYHVNAIVFNKGSFEMHDDITDSLQLQVENLNLKLSDVRLNNSTKDEKIPFSTKQFSLNADSLQYRMGDYENLKVASLDASFGHTNLQGLQLKTKYSKSELTRRIKKERDHFDLEIDNVEISEQDFGYVNDSTPYFKAGRIDITKPVFNIYRNKLVADDNTVKNLYSKQLRDLSLELTLNKINVDKGFISYSEKVKQENPPGEIEFENITATIEQLSNTYPEGELTKIHFEGQFMEDAPISVDWNFDVNNTADYFTFRANVGTMPVDDLNAFIRPSQNVMLEGKLLKTLFSIEGNRNTSNIDLKIDYDDFKVTILRKDGKSKNSLLSGIANLLVKKSSQGEEGDFRKGTKTTVERDKTKSVFNYVWINISKALIDAML